MKLFTKILSILLFTFWFSTYYAQNTNKKNHKSNAGLHTDKINIPQVLGENIKIKDEDFNVLLQVTDEGANGSIKIFNGVPALKTNRIYSDNGVLYFNGSMLTNLTSSGGWTKNANNIFTETSADNVGIGTTNPLSKLSVGGNGNSETAMYSVSQKNTGIGVYGHATSIYQANYGGYFVSEGIWGIGLYGEANHGSVFSLNGINGLGTSYGGYFEGIGDKGRGIYGETDGTGGYGVRGFATNSGQNIFADGGFFRAEGQFGIGAFAIAPDMGVKSQTIGSLGIAVYGLASSSNTSAKNYGGYFAAEDIGVKGEVFSNHSLPNFYGGKFLANGGTGIGAFGEATGGDGVGIYGYSSDIGDGIGEINYGGYFVANGNDGCGIYAEALSTGYAGFFLGNVHITGALSKGMGSFKIDHPLDPENKYLYHSFVESPDMMNMYNGNIITDENGNANIELPDWFDALNKDFKYQLTVIGHFAKAMISEKISNNLFAIKTNKPNVKVSWQVTGIRHDAYANKNRIKVEVLKPEKERGKYLHPEAFGKPKAAGINYNKDIDDEINRMKERRNIERMRNADIHTKIKRDRKTLEVEREKRKM